VAMPEGSRGTTATLLAGPMLIGWRLNLLEALGFGRRYFSISLGSVMKL
jgi:hypothetical protein